MRASAYFESDRPRNAWITLDDDDDNDDGDDEYGAQIFFEI